MTKLQTKRNHRNFLNKSTYTNYTATLISICITNIQSSQEICWHFKFVYYWFYVLIRTFFNNNILLINNIFRNQPLSVQDNRFPWYLTLIGSITNWHNLTTTTYTLIYISKNITKPVDYITIVKLKSIYIPGTLTHTHLTISSPERKCLSLSQTDYGSQFTKSPLESVVRHTANFLISVMTY